MSLLEEPKFDEQQLNTKQTVSAPMLRYLLFGQIASQYTKPLKVASTHPAPIHPTPIHPTPIHKVYLKGHCATFKWFIYQLGLELAIDEPVWKRGDWSV